MYVTPQPIYVCIGHHHLYMSTYIACHVQYKSYISSGVKYITNIAIHVQYITYISCGFRYITYIGSHVQYII